MLLVLLQGCCSDHHDGGSDCYAALAVMVVDFVLHKLAASMPVYIVAI